MLYCFTGIITEILLTFQFCSLWSTACEVCLIHTENQISILPVSAEDWFYTFDGKLVNPIRNHSHYLCCALIVTQAITLHEIFYSTSIHINKVIGNIYTITICKYMHVFICTEPSGYITFPLPTKKKFYSLDPPPPQKSSKAPSLEEFDIAS